MEEIWNIWAGCWFGNTVYHCSKEACVTTVLLHRPETTWMRWKEWVMRIIKRYVGWNYQTGSLVVSFQEILVWRLKLAIWWDNTNSIGMVTSYSKMPRMFKRYQASQLTRHWGKDANELHPRKLETSWIDCRKFLYWRNKRKQIKTSSTDPDLPG